MVAIFCLQFFLIHVNGMPLKSFTVLTRRKSLHANRSGRTRLRALNNFIANTLPTNIYIIRHGNLPIEPMDLTVAKSYPCRVNYP